MYAVTRSIVRALLDQISTEDLTDINTDKADVTLRQLAKTSRLQRDKGMRGDGFEWAVHEAIQGQEPSVIEPLALAMRSASWKSFKDVQAPQSLLFGFERAKYLGFLDAVVNTAPDEAVILPDTRGRPSTFGKWVPIAAKGQASEPLLGDRLKKVWKTDLFVSDEDRRRHLAVTIKSNARQLEAGPGLRLGIVPETRGINKNVHYEWNKARTDGLWIVSLADPHGFMGLFNDAYGTVAEAVATLGRHDRGGKYWAKPSPMGQEIQAQLESFATRKVQDVCDGLNDAAQQNLLGVDNKLISVDAPSWLHLGKPRPTNIVAPKPSFIKLD